MTFDDERLVADAGLIQPATLAQHLGLRGLFDIHVDLGDARGRANVGDKAMTLIHSALADGDSIDDCDALRAGSTHRGRVGPHRAGSLDAGHVPALVHVGPCPPTRPGLR